MRRTGVVYPCDLSIHDGSVVRNGPAVLETEEDVDYSLSIVKFGERINPANYALTVSNDPGRVAGDHLIRAIPADGGLTLNATRNPFNFVYRYEDGDDRFIGQNHIMAREYSRFLVAEANNTATTVNLRNVRMFNHRGNLMLLGESFKKVGTDNLGFVSLYIYDSLNKIFRVVKRFDDFPCDTVRQGNYQLGCPDYYIYQGSLYVMFRIVNREKNKTYINVFKADTSDYASWKNISATEIENQSSIEQVNFRLRATEGDGVVMAVIYGLSTVARPGYNAENHDMRAYVSFDGGYSFKTSSQYNKNVRVDSNGGVVVVPASASLFAMFVSSYNEDQYEPEQNGFNHRFDLYYDKNMGSFVVLKGSDAPTGVSDGTTYLMGIKTTPENVLLWDVCLRYKLDVKATGLNDNEDPYNEVLPSSAPDAYTLEVLDICVVPEETSNVLFIQYKVQGTFETDPYQHGGVAVMEAAFVPSDAIAKGDYNTIFAYGGSFHDEYAFLCTPMHPDQTNIFGTGNRSTSANGELPVACLWRGQIVSSFRNSDTARYEVLCFHRPFSNLGEENGYESSYPRWILDPAAYDWNKAINGGGIFTTLTNEGLVQCSSPTTGKAWLSLVASIGGAHKTTLQRAGMDDRLQAKARFSVRVGGLSSGNQVEFFRMRLSNYENYVNGIATKIKSVSLSFNFDGEIIMSDTDGYSYGVINPSFLLGVGLHYEFYVAIGQAADQSDRIVVWCREIGDFYWIFFTSTVIVPQMNSVSEPNIRVGLVDYNVYNSAYTVDVGDLMVSSFGSGYRSYNSKSKTTNDTPMDSAFNYGIDGYDQPESAARINAYSNFVVLHDGTVVDFRGGFLKKNTAIAWDVSSAISSNDMSSMISQTADFAYDFTGLSGFNCIFNNINQVNVDAVSLINVFGVVGLDVRVGTYDSDLDSWSNYEDVSYQIPVKKIDVSNFQGKYLLLNESFEHNIYAGYSIHIYNTLTGDWEGQLRVVENFKSTVKLDTNVSSITNREFYLSSQSVTFNVPEEMIAICGRHIQISVTSLPNATLSCIGQVVFGNLYDTTKYTSSVEYESSGNSDPSRSERGFGYSEISYAGPGVDIYTLTADKTYRYDDESARLGGMLYSIYENKWNVPIVETNQEFPVTYYGAIDSYNYNPAFPSDSFDAVFVLQRWFGKRNIPRTSEPPTLYIYANKNDINAGQSISFTASGSSENAPITYVWDFGDLTGDTGASVSKTYSLEGSYTVKCAATDAAGNVTLKSLLVYVIPAQIEAVNLTLSGSSPYPISTPIAATITALDSAASPVVFDNSTVVALDYSISDLEIDFNNDGIYNGGLNDVLAYFVDGEIVFSIMSLAPGTYTINVNCSNGVSNAFSLTFA